MLIYRSKNQCYLININFIEVVLKFLHQNPQVSTIDQSLNLQLDALNEFGCDEILKKWFQEPKLIAQYSFSRNSNNF
jgi:hypothetical protein